MHLDSRSLALFRMALGALVFALAWQLRPDYAAFYTPESTPHFIWALLYIILPLCSIFLAAGFRSRLSALLCWAGVIAVQQGNPDILYGGDMLLRLLLFWSIFLPLDRAWALDLWLFKKTSSTLPVTDRWAPWAITAQICFVYWFAALSKTDPLWTQNHNALFYALSISDVTSPWGSAMRQYPALLQWLTAATLYLEFLGPFLLFIPFYRDRCRMLAVILFFIFHLIGMQSLMLLGFFPWVCATAWLIFIPSFFWNGLGTTAGRSVTQISPASSSSLLDRGMAALMIFAFAVVLTWNLAHLHDTKTSGSNFAAWLRIHDPSKRVLHLDQRWDMYAPMPYPDHGWLVIPSTLDDGTEVDLFTGRALSWSIPGNIADYLGSDRWRCYLARLMSDRNQASMEHYSDYLVNKWNAEHPKNQRVKELTLVFMKQSTLPNLTVSSPEKITIYQKTF